MILNRIIQNAGAAGLLVALLGFPPAAPAGESRESAARKFTDIGGSVRLANRGTDALEVDLRFCDASFSEAHLALLADLGSVAVLRLNRLPVTDAGLAHLSDLHSLTRLHLEETQVTDAALKHLADLPNLAYLNLFRTRTGDAIPGLIRSLPALKQIHLAETQIAPSDITRIKKEFPHLAVTPDPDTDKIRALTILKDSESTRDRAADALALAEKNFQNLHPLAEQLKREAEEKKKVAEQSKKNAEAAKKPHEDARRRADDLRRQADEAEKRAKAKSGDDGLKRQAEETRRRAAEALAHADAASEKYAQIRSQDEALQISYRELQRRADLARNSEKLASEARDSLAAAQAQVDDARKYLAELPPP